jgi:hypothetical protein
MSASSRRPWFATLPLAPVRLALLALLALGCREQFRFDEPHPEAGVASDDDAGDRASPDAAESDSRADDVAVAEAASGPEGDAGCPAGGCNWRRRDDCTSAGCGLECPGRTTCDGSCGDGCRAECEAHATCILSTGRQASVTCEASSCTLELGAASTAYCAADATCKLRCVSSCSVSCSATSHCTLACPGEKPHAFTGSATCP